MDVAEQIKNIKAECHPVTDLSTIMIRWLDRGQKVIASKHRFSWLRQYGYTFSTVASTESYALSPLVDTSKLIVMYDKASTSFQYMDNMTEQEFRYWQPGPDTTGSPYLYRIVGRSPVQNQPTSSSALALVSSSGSDTTVVVSVQGLNGSGILVNETVTMTGGTPVSTSNSYTKVLSLSKSAVSIGTITVTSNAGVVTNVVIAPKDRHVSHPVISMFNIPDAVYTIYYDFTMKLPSLTATTDISLIPEQYHDVIELYAIQRCYKHLNNTTMAQSTFMEFENRIRDMINDDYQPSSIWTMDKYSPSPGVQIAKLPSWYPRND